MGRVKVDIHKKEYEFRNVTLSDPNTVLALIAMRFKVDPYYDFGYKSAVMDAENWNHVNQEVICLYADLDVLIKECGFSFGERTLIEAYQMGYTKQEIADMVREDQRVIGTKMKNIAKQICDLNYHKWRIWLYLNYIKTEWKRCRICGEKLPLNERFFNEKETSRDGFRTECKECYYKITN